jgi:peroxiredoxin
MSSLEELTAAAEDEWLANWTTGPSEAEGSGLPRGAVAPDLVLADDTGKDRNLSEFWAERPGLLMFWRHFGCGCGVDRAQRLAAEYASYLDAGLSPVIIAQGEPARAAAYRDEHTLPCPILCDPDHVAYRAYGLGQWSVARVLFDAPAEYWEHAHDLGRHFQTARRTAGRAPVDDPWRATGEFVVGTDGLVHLPYTYQYCEDYPDPRVLTAAGRLSRRAAVGPRA